MRHLGIDRHGHLKAVEPDIRADFLIDETEGAMTDLRSALDRSMNVFGDDRS